MKWYKNSYRRHLLDMHIDDWENGIFLSKFSAEEYYNNLKIANVKSAMIYLQSHIGYCYYPTKVGHMHSAFIGKTDEMKKLVDLCHKGGIDVTAYYSINYTTVEVRSHPDWALIYDANGSLGEFSGQRYLLCCPNNPDYRNFVLDQTKEIMEYADFDGMFFDMPFWNGICYCEHCRKKFKEEYSLEMPTSKEGEVYKTLLAAREKWNGEYLADINERVYSLKPDISIQYNYAHAALDFLEIMGSETVNEYQDYASGDISTDFLTQSFACKLFYSVTKNKPFEFMTVRCDPGLSAHTVTKSPDKMRLALSITQAHHGANFVIDAIDPIGTMDGRFYDFLGELYRGTEKYEPYMDFGNMIADVGLFYSLEGKTLGEKYPYSHYNATFGAAKSLIQKHIPYNVITQATVDNIDNYRAVVMANPNRLNEKSLNKIVDYVKQGGILYFSGSDEPVLLKELLGAEYYGHTNSNAAYASPEKGMEGLFENFNKKYPVPFRYNLPKIKCCKGEVLATINLPYTKDDPIHFFSSIHSNPPGEDTDLPAVVKNKVGKGTVIWSAGQFEAEKTFRYRNVLKNLLEFAGLKDLSIKSTASETTEVVGFKDDTGVLVSAYYLTDNEFTEIQRPFEISVKCENVPKKVTLVPTGEEINFSYSDGYVTFKTKELNVFDMYKIEL